MGASIQIAYSLGLHRDSITDSGASMEREQNRRIWWTLFTLDQEIASRGGSPTLIDERHLRITTPLPSEQVIDHGLSSSPRLTTIDPVSRNAHSSIMAHHIRFPMSPQTRDHPGNLHRTLYELSHHLLHDRFQTSAFLTRLAATDATSPQTRRSRPTNTQASRCRTTPPVLEYYYTTLPTVPPLPRHEA